ncbi:PepSY-associated TM helix domain-containing protein [Paenibacillus hexagrammi]|uniref:PepSY domain-containing protein n=1 Tax=Paenibacillus hexagrammi TaxID=2908839 RepID=A0ABY3SHS9_9BACL|nr:PepSY-associated TM helix domain-containing protein [Paenibacillus sp. YPD9-1]UJF33452.1 PepSY domain-containing protein [Paenibacillus sp. YPD9-1]
MKKTRQLHLWIGLICSVFILIQSITGLLLTEKWLLGGGDEMRPPQATTQNMTQQPAMGEESSGTTGAAADPSAAASSGQSAPSMASEQGRPSFQGGEGPGQAGGIIGIVKGLHEGKIGQTDVSWLIDLTAIGMIVLTVTGITLSIKTLRAQRVQQRKRRAAGATA